MISLVFLICSNVFSFIISITTHPLLGIRETQFSEFCSDEKLCYSGVPGNLRKSLRAPRKIHLQIRYSSRLDLLLRPLLLNDKYNSTKTLDYSLPTFMEIIVTLCAFFLNTLQIAAEHNSQFVLIHGNTRASQIIFLVIKICEEKIILKCQIYYRKSLKLVSLFTVFFKLTKIMFIMETPFPTSK